MSLFITEATNNKKMDLNKVPFLKNKDISDPSDVSCSDFQPKRFGLKYDPPQIGKFSFGS